MRLPESTLITVIFLTGILVANYVTAAPKAVHPAATMAENATCTPAQAQEN